MCDDGLKNLVELESLGKVLGCRPRDILKLRGEEDAAHRPDRQDCLNSQDAAKTMTL